MAIGIYKKSNGDIAKLVIFENESTIYEIETMYDNVLHINKFTITDKTITTETHLHSFYRKENRSDAIDRFVFFKKFIAIPQSSYSDTVLATKVINRSSIYY